MRFEIRITNTGTELILIPEGEAEQQLIGNAIGKAEEIGTLIAIEYSGHATYAKAAKITIPIGGR